MTDVKTVLVVGAAGHLGHQIAQALLDRPEKLAVRAAARNTSRVAPSSVRLDQLKSRGATLVEVDVASGAGLDAACNGADVVISALQGGADMIIEGQGRLLQACLRAGVGRLVPSDYAIDLFALDDGENLNLDLRRAFAAEVRASGIGHSFMLNGAFMDVVLSPFMPLIDESAGTLSHWGDGKIALDFTSMTDTAAFLAAAVLDPSTLNRPIEVAGDRLDIASLRAAYEGATGRALVTVRLGSIEEGYAELDRLKSQTEDPMALLPLMYVLPMLSGKARLKNVENARFPDVRPQSLQAFLSAHRGGDS